MKPDQRIDTRVSVLGLLAAGLPALLVQLALWIHARFEYDLPLQPQDYFDPAWIAFGVYGQMLIVGAPLAWFLHRNDVTSPTTFGLTGAVAGALIWAGASGLYLLVGFDPAMSEERTASIRHEIYLALHASAACGAVGGVAYILTCSANARRRTAKALAWLRRARPLEEWMGKETRRTD